MRQTEDPCLFVYAHLSVLLLVDLVAAGMGVGVNSDQFEFVNKQQLRSQTLLLLHWLLGILAQT